MRLLALSPEKQVRVWLARAQGNASYGEIAQDLLRGTPWNSNSTCGAFVLDVVQRLASESYEADSSTVDRDGWSVVFRKKVRMKALAKHDSGTCEAPQRFRRGPATSFGHRDCSPIFPFKQVRA